MSSQPAPPSTASAWTKRPPGTGPSGLQPRPKPAAKRPVHASLSSGGDSSNIAASTEQQRPQLTIPSAVPSYAELTAKHRQHVDTPPAIAAADATTSESKPSRAAMLADKIAKGKKLGRSDFANLGYSEKEVEALRLHRGLKYRETEQYQAKQQQQLEEQREKAVARWKKGGEADKASKTVFMSDLLGRAVDAAPPLPPSTTTKVDATAASKAKKNKVPTATAQAGVSAAAKPAGAGQPKSAWGTAAAAAAVGATKAPASDAPALPPALPAGTTKPLPPTAAPVTKSKTAASKKPAEPRDAPSMAAAPAEDAKPRIRLLSGGLTLKKNAKGVSSSLLAALQAAGAAGSRSGAIAPGRKAKTVRASAVLTASAATTGHAPSAPSAAAVAHSAGAGMAKGFKVKQYRRIKKPSKTKWLVLQARKRALEAAMQAVEDVPVTSTTAAATADLDDLGDAEWADVGCNETDAAVSKRAGLRRERARRAAVKAIAGHVTRLSKATELHRMAREAYDNRDRDLLEERKRLYAQAYGRVQRSHLHTLRRFVECGGGDGGGRSDAGGAISVAAKVVTAAGTFPAAAPTQQQQHTDGADEGDDGDDGPTGDPETEAIAALAAAPRRQQQHAAPQLPRGAVVFPSLHLLTASGAHAAPWMVDQRFVPDPKFVAKRFGKTDGASTPAAAAIPTVEQLRAAMCWDTRPWWWPPARVVRDYVTNMLTRELDKATETLVTRLHGLQLKLKQNQPQKFKKQMRFVLGLREAQRGLNAKRVKLVIIAPDVEAADVLDAAVKKIIATCEANGVVYFFASSRGGFGRAVNQFKNRISLCAIYSAEGAYEELRKAVALARDAKAAMAEQLARREPTPHDQCAPASTAEDA